VHYNSGIGPSFPTPNHRAVAELAREFFHSADRARLVDTTLIVNSCARGQATAASDLDMAVLAVGGTSADIIGRLTAAWEQFAARDARIVSFRALSPSARIHLDVFDGCFTPAAWDEGGGPDTFEIEIGNRVAHAAPLGAAGPRFAALRGHWLPYYGEALRSERLAMASAACIRDIELVAAAVDRGLHFYAFDRLSKAVQEFLQALFIARRTYPIAYNKWVEEQVGRWLGLPEVCRELLAILSIQDVGTREIIVKAHALRTLLDRAALAAR
jgi:predicted nucleotidyltransferase